MIGFGRGLLEVFQVEVIVSNLPKVRMLLRLDILLNQLVEEVGIAMFDNTDDLIPRNLMVAIGGVEVSRS
jgi:hypothetical protein